MKTIIILETDKFTDPKELIGNGITHLLNIGHENLRLQHYTSKQKNFKISLQNISK